MSRVYGADVLMQLLVCYAFVLIFDDVVRMVWGPEFKSMGMPAAFQVVPLFIAGGVVPPYYLLLIGVALVMAVVLGLGLARTRIGKVIRAAAHNPGMVSALGINTGLIYGGVFALGGMLAGLAGALAAPVRSLTPGMGFSVLIESFIVTVIGGMGSILGALIGALLIGLIRSFGSLGFPAVHRRPDVPVHGDRAGLPAYRPVRQGSRMTELQAARASDALNVARSRGYRAAFALSRCADRAGRLRDTGDLAAVLQQQGAARFCDPLLGFWPVRDVAQFAGRLHRHDFVRPRHVLRPRRLWFRTDHAANRRTGPGGLRRNAGDHGHRRDCHRRDLRAAEGNLFRLRHAGVPDADPQHHSVVGIADRRRPGPARRHSAPGLPRHRPVEPRAFVRHELRAAGDRPACDAPDRAIAVRLYACA